MEKLCYIANYEHLGTVCWGRDTMRKLFQTEDERLQRYPGVKYGWDNEAYTYDNLAEEEPELLEQMRRMLAQYPGRIAIGATSYGQPLSYYINGESNVRQLVEGIRTDLQHFGVRPYVYIMSEQGMHAQIPQLIHQAGFRGAIMRTAFCMYGVNPEYPASCINWMGLDGAIGVPTVPTYPGEQCHCAVNGATHDRRTLEFAFFGNNPMDNKILLDYPVDAPWGGLEEFRDRFGGRIKNVIAFRADDPRQPEGVIAEYHQKDGFPWVLDEEILAAAGAPELDVRTAVNDFHFRMPWGLCGNWIWERCREYESRLYTLDLLDALRARDGAADHGADLREAWKMLMINQHHDVQICGIESDAKKFFARGDRALARIEQDLLGEERPFRFNPLPWTRRDGAGETALAVTDAKPQQETGIVCEDLVLNTPWYTVALAPTGGFLSVWDKSRQRNLFVSGRVSGALAGMIDGIPCIGQGLWRFRPGCGQAELVEEGTIGGIPYTVTWTFYDRHDRVDCRMDFAFDRQFIGRKSGTPQDAMAAFQHEEKLRMKFYPNLPDSAMGWRDQPFGAAASNRQSLECNLWAAVTDQDQGFAIFNHGIQCVCRELDGALSVPLAFSMYYCWSASALRREDGSCVRMDRDLLWEKRYRDEDIRKKQQGLPHEELVSIHFLHGHYTTHLAFMPFSGDWKTAQLHRRALEYLHPCVDIPAETASVLRRADLELDLPENLFVSSVYGQDGGLYIRLYEMEGRDAQAKIRLGGQPVQLQPTDFFEVPTGDPVETAMLHGCEVRTFRIL